MKKNAFITARIAVRDYLIPLLQEVTGSLIFRRLSDWNVFTYILWGCVSGCHSQVTVSLLTHAAFRTTVLGGLSGKEAEVAWWGLIMGSVMSPVAISSGLDRYSYKRLPLLGSLALWEVICDLIWGCCSWSQHPVYFILADNINNRPIDRKIQWWGLATLPLCIMGLINQIHR